MANEDEKQKPKAERNGCWRCGSHDVDFINRWIRLIGGYHAKLCAECLNDWEVRIRDNPLMLRLYDIERRQIMIQCRSIHDGEDRAEDLMQLSNEKIATEKELFALAEVWTDDVIERPKPAPPPPPTEEEIAAMRDRRRKRLEAQLDMLKREDELMVKQ